MENVLLVFPDSPGSLVSVRTFRVEERLSGLFEIVVTAVTPDESLDLSGIVGRSAVFTLVWSSVRVWSGVCEEAQFVRVSETGEGLATFEFRIRPTLWRLTQRVQNRLFQHQSIPEIVSSLMSDWKIPYEWNIAEAQYPPLELRTQFGETDFAFVSRLLEEAGISYWFRPREEGDMTIVFGDAPQANEERGLPLPFVDDAAQAQASRAPFLTKVRLRERSRPGKITHREYDPTRARTPIYASAESDRKQELAHEIYRFAPGSHLREDPGAAQAGSDDPLVMDDLGVARFDPAFGAQRARRELEALHSDRRVLTFEASVNDLAPGVVFRIANHPRVDLAVAASFLVTSLVSEGEVARTNTWRFLGAGVSTDRPHRPAMTTSKPNLPGLQTAVVVGPMGQRSATQRGAGGVGELSNTALDTNATVGSLPDDDVYVDEQGRVRVQFPWDRDHSYSSESSIWMRVSQGWAGGGYGSSPSLA
jgi:type VI secretion system secreted protein VgrG